MHPSGAQEDASAGSPDGPVGWDDVLALMADLKRTARGLLAREGNAGSIHTTHLVNSALRKLTPRSRDWEEVTWQDREAFFKAAFFSMRRVLIDHARRRTVRRQVQVGGFESKLVAPLVEAGVLNLDRLMDQSGANRELAEAVVEALEGLERRYSRDRLGDIVQHSVFFGLNQAEIAGLLGISERTVRTRLKLAYALLAKELRRFFAGDATT